MQGEEHSHNEVEDKTWKLKEVANDYKIFVPYLELLGSIFVETLDQI